MSDVFFGKTKVDAVSEEIVSVIVQDLLIQEAKLLPTVQNFSALAGPGMDKIKIPKAGGFTVGNKAEGTAVSAQALTYSTDDLDLDKHKVVQVLAEDFAILQSKVDAVQDIAKRAAKALALQIDTDIITALVNTSATSPDHRIALAGSSFAEEDILSARKLLNDALVPLDDRFLVIPTEFEKSALKIANFIQQDRYAGNTAIVSGEIGMAYGFRLIVHTGLTTTAVAYHKSHVAAAIQQGLRYQTAPQLEHLAIRHSFDQVYGVKTLDAGKRGVLLGSAT
jgi:N4-gp56 family major capsid protein